MAYVAPMTGRAEMSATSLTRYTITTTNVIDGERFHPFTLILELTAVSGLVTVPTISLGVVGPNYVDLLPATALTGMTTVGHSRSFPLSEQVYSRIDPGTAVNMPVSVAANATTYTLKAMLIGVYALLPPGV